MGDCVHYLQGAVSIKFISIAVTWATYALITHAGMENNLDGFSDH